MKKATNAFKAAAQESFSTINDSDLPPPIRRYNQDGPPPPPNATMLEAFEWNCPKDQKHWTRLTAALPSLKTIGIDNIWIPPGCKGGWHGSNGYDVYDLYDLGEFEQKDSRKTKWGSWEELKEMSELAQRYGVGIYWDVVLNHKAAADFSEPCYAVKVDPKGRVCPRVFLKNTSSEARLPLLLLLLKVLPPIQYLLSKAKLG